MLIKGHQALSLTSFTLPGERQMRDKDKRSFSSSECMPPGASVRASGGLPLLSLKEGDFNPGFPFIDPLV